MAHYSFTLRVSGTNTNGDRFEEALYKAGCADALVSVIDGRLILNFDREARSYEEAVASARRNVEEAGGRVIKVERIED